MVNNSSSSKRRNPHLFVQFIDTLVDFAATGGRSIWATPPSHETIMARKLPATLWPATERVIAIGDLHGDIEKTRQVFQVAGLTDNKDRWIAGSTVAVQVGDQLDRGHNELDVLLYLEMVERQAIRRGGRLHVMLGNHETMSINGDFRYAFRRACQQFETWEKWFLLGRHLKRKCGIHLHPFPAAPIDVHPENRSRLRALQPGGPLSLRFFSHRNSVLIIGQTMFVHGGVLPAHVDFGLPAINRLVSDWIKSSPSKIPRVVGSSSGVVWSRAYSREDPFSCKCEILEEVLRRTATSRLVMGHTIQHLGINTACNGQAVRIDVGLSKGCDDAKPQALLILNDTKLEVLS